MIPADKGIVQPISDRRTPKLGSVAVMAATQADFEELRRHLGLPRQRNLFLSRLCYCEDDDTKPSLVGPVMGAPYAAMLLETLYAWGVEKLIFYGWCGSIDSQIRSGDIILPDSAIIDEGTSAHYHKETGATVHPNGALRSVLSDACDNRSIRQSSGRIWTTDGIFRETPERVERFQSEGAVGVDMELSALCSVALFHDLPLAAVLVVSDELFDLQWRPGFKQPEFKVSRARVCETLVEIIKDGFHE